MKIVVLDGYTLNPGDLDWQGLEKLGQLSVYERTSVDLIVERAIDADIVLTNKTPLDAKILSQLPSLRYIGVLATGTNVVDVATANERGVVVTNVPAYGPDAVAQMVFAHILHYTQKVAAHHQAVQAGQWQNGDDFCFTLAPLQSLKGKVLGLVGFGDIGQQVASIAVAFGMTVLIHTRRQKDHLPRGITWCDLDTLFQSSDFVSLHCPLSEQTFQMINQQRLSQMKSSAMLVNTGRGDLVDESALANALLNGDIAFAGVDVLSTEPPQPDNPLLNVKNMSITPHNAWATLEARQNLLNIAVNNLESYLAGAQENQVY